MPGALEALDDILSGIDAGATTPGEAIERVLDAQIHLRVFVAETIGSQRKAQVSEYYRQYVGITREGGKIIYVNGVHQSVIDQLERNRSFLLKVSVQNGNEVRL